MPKDSELHTAIRLLAMLKHLERQPRKSTAAELAGLLAEDGFDITKRTVERNLKALVESNQFQITCDNPNNRPIGWFWRRDAKPLNIPALDPQTALTFSLVEKHLKPLLPAATLSRMQPYFQSATGVLKQINKPVSRWPDKVRVLPRGLRLLAPNIDPKVQEAVYQALLEEKRLRIRYERRTKDWTINPMALVVRDAIVYLIWTMVPEDNPKQLVLHRIKSAEVLYERSTAPKDFNIDAYIASGEFDWPADDRGAKKIKLQALFDRGAAAHLYETPLSTDQTITDVDEDTVRLRATVLHTHQLEWWLWGFGDAVEVVSPKRLRSAFKETVAGMHRRYR
jgi:predicted DNA-binding transcriptional regulator YafY